MCGHFTLLQFFLIMGSWRTYSHSSMHLIYNIQVYLLYMYNIVIVKLVGKLLVMTHKNYYCCATHAAPTFCMTLFLQVWS